MQWIRRPWILSAWTFAGSFAFLDAAVQLRSSLEQILEAGTGGQTFVQLHLVNDASEPCGVELEAADFLIQPNGEIQLSVQLSAEESFFSCKEWLQIPEEPYVLGPHEEKHLKLPIKVPEGSSPRSTWAMLYVSPKATNQVASGDCYIHALFRYGIQIIVDVGERPTDMNLEISAPKIMEDSLQWTVSNPTKWVYKPKAESMLFDAMGEDRGSCEISGGKILPGHHRLYNGEKPKLPGSYTAIFLLDDGRGSTLGVRDLLEIATIPETDLPAAETTES